MGETKTKKNILVCDDNKNILHIVHLFLTKAGYAVIAKNNAKAALEVIQKGNVDLALMDVMMPGMSGFDAIQAMQKNPATPQVPVILMTARAIIEHSSRPMLWRVYGYIIKPFTNAQLLEKIEEVLAMTEKMKKSGKKNG